MKKLLFLIMLLVMSSFAFADLETDTSIYIPFDDSQLSGSNPLDLTSNNYDGSNTGAATGVSGVINESFLFSHSDDDIVEFTDWDNLVTGTGSYTVNIWYYVDTASLSTSNRYNLFSGWTSNTASRQAECRIEQTTGNIFCIHWIDSSNNNVVVEIPKAQIVDEQWTMVSTVYDDANDEFRVYQNCVLKDTHTAAVGSNNGGTVTVGNFDLLGRAFEGRLDEFSVLDGDYSSSLCDLYNAGAANQYYPTPSTSSAYFHVTATGLSDLNLTFDNGTTLVNATGNIINTTILQNSSSLWNFTLSSTNHFNKSFLNYNVSEDLTTTLSTYPIINVQDTWDNTVISNFTILTHTLLIENIQLGSQTFTNSTQNGFYFTTNDVFLAGTGELVIYETGNVFNNVAYGVGELENNTYYINTDFNSNGNGITVACATGIGGTCNINLSEFGVINNYTTIGSDLYLPFNESKLLTASKTNYFDNKTTVSLLADSNTTVYLPQTDIKFNASQLYTNNSVTSNYTIDGVTKDNDESFYLSAGTYNVTFQATGYYSVTEELTFDALDNETYTFTDVSTRFNGVRHN